MIFKLRLIRQTEGDITFWFPWIVLKIKSVQRKEPHKNCSKWMYKFICLLCNWDEFICAVLRLRMPLLEAIKIDEDTFCFFYSLRKVVFLFMFWNINFQGQKVNLKKMYCSSDILFPVIATWQDYTHFFWLKNIP